MNKELYLHKTEFGLSESEIQSIKDIFRQYPEIVRAILFGSRAKGNYKKYSDIDITLIGDHLNQKLLFEIELRLDDMLLPYIFDISLYKQIDNQDLIEHIQRVGKIFYEKER